MSASRSSAPLRFRSFTFIAVERSCRDLISELCACACVRACVVSVWWLENEGVKRSRRGCHMNTKDRRSDKERRARDSKASVAIAVGPDGAKIHLELGEHALHAREDCVARLDLVVQRRQVRPLLQIIGNALRQRTSRVAADTHALARQRTRASERHT